MCKSFKYISLILLFNFLFILNGCKKDKNENTVFISHIEENITEPQTWTSGGIYIIDKSDLEISAALTIEPGVVVKFTSSGPGMTLKGEGVIIATGTSDQHIVFTSIKDDKHGGDSNGDGNASNPSMYNWGSVITNTATSSEFYYCDFYYGGNFRTPTLSIRSYTGAKVIHCTFAYNSGFEDKLGALDCSQASHTTEVRNCTFYSNSIPLSINTDMSIDNSNTFHKPDYTNVTNAFNLIIVKSVSISENITWAETEVAFFISDVNLWITGSLTLADDVVLKFDRFSEIKLKHGENDIVNHDGPGVYFTSIHDDSLKGDSDGDNSSHPPLTGDWTGIFDSTTGTYLKWPNILYSNP